MGWVVRWLMVGDNHPEGRPGPRLKPWEIGRMTLAEIAWTLDQPAPGDHLGREPMSDQEIAAYQAWMQGLSAEEFLAASKSGQLL